MEVCDYFAYRRHVECVLSAWRNEAKEVIAWSPGLAQLFPDVNFFPKPSSEAIISVEHIAESRDIE